MRYLLDVNALLALGHTGHEFHARVAKWAEVVSEVNRSQFATSPITELGFVRIMSQVYGATVAESQSLLEGLKQFNDLDFTFLADDQDASKLPRWAMTSKQTTDGHLTELARANDCVLATLDEKIPGAFVIPV